MMICNSGHLSDGLGNMQSWTFDYLASGCEMFVHTSPCVLWIYFSSLKPPNFVGHISLVS